jgi:hypothetical protein
MWTRAFTPPFSTEKALSFSVCLAWSLYLNHFTMGSKKTNQKSAHHGSTKTTVNKKQRDSFMEMANSTLLLANIH